MAKRIARPFFISQSTRKLGINTPLFSSMNEQVVILDFGSQYTQVIARRIRECKVYSIILHYNTPASEIAAMKPKGIILSGGPSSVYSPKGPASRQKDF